MWSSVVPLVFLVVLVGGVIAIPILPFNETRADDDIAYRLPNYTRPITYDIYLTTNIHRQDLKFTGKVVIDVEVLSPTAAIYLHARQLKINSGSIHLAWDEGMRHDVSFLYDERTEFLIVEIAGILLVGGVYTLTLEYEGTLRRDGGGFYVQSYKNARGDDVFLATTQFESTNARHGFPCYDEPQVKAIFRVYITHGENYNAISNMPVMGPIVTKFLATTQFEATGARYAFPCYDEPDKKSIFKLTITHGQGYSAISNMPVLGNILQNGDGTVTTTFEPTTLMSTYLVAWTISDYVFTEKSGRIPHRVYSKPGYDKQHEFALDTSIAVLESLADYVDLKYPLPKMDNVAIPQKGGAMENWGSVTYGEQYILYNEEETTTSAKTTIATIISHEFAHQWFGDMVGPKWWTYTWLNEGFASLFEYYTTSLVYPEWDIMQAFITGYLQRALVSDTQKNPRPMTYYAESPAGIAGVFDYVSYAKAGSVLRMFQYALGPETFRKALKNYQAKMKYLAAVEEDLFEAFKIAANEDQVFGNVALDFDGMFKSWTNQGGFPLLTVSRDYAAGTFTIRQEPFDGTDNPSLTRSWWVPYNYASATSGNAEATDMQGYLLPGTATATIQPDTQIAAVDWLLLNKQATSYYRVNYDAENWQLLAKALNSSYKSIPIPNRAQLMHDCSALIAPKLTNFSMLFDLMSYLEKEDQYAPWATATSLFSSLYNYLSADKEYRALRFFIKKSTQNFYKFLGVDGRSDDLHLNKMIRGSIVTWACRANNTDCLAAANAKLKRFGESQTKIESDMRATIMCAGTMSGGKFELDLMLQSLKEVEVQATRNQILSGLGCLPTVEILTEYLGTAIKYPSDYSSSERLNILGYVVEKSANGVTAAMDFLSANYQEYQKLSSNLQQSNPVLTAIRNIASRTYTEDQSKQFEQLLERVVGLEGITADQLNSVRATVRNNLNWTENNRKEIMEWMGKYYEDNGGKDEEGDGDGDDGAASVIISTSALAVAIITSFRVLF